MAKNSRIRQLGLVWVAQKRPKKSLMYLGKQLRPVSVMNFGQGVVGIRGSIEVHIFLDTRVKCVLGLAAGMDFMPRACPLDATHVGRELVSAESLHLMSSNKF